MAHDRNSFNINAIHDQGMRDHFIAGIGKKAFILSPSYPFMFVGQILDVMDDLLLIDVETTHFSQLENRTWFIHIDNIEVFYIEREGEIKIPELNDLT